MNNKQRNTIEGLKKIYIDAKPGLHYNNAFELLIATIMSAQTTDRQVNEVTKTLFVKYPDAKSLCALDIEELEQAIKSTGFYRAKAGNVKRTACILKKEYSGEVPRTMEELTKLPGVGRKDGQRCSVERIWHTGYSSRHARFQSV